MQNTQRFSFVDLGESYFAALNIHRAVLGLFDDLTSSSPLFHKTLLMDKLQIGESEGLYDGSLLDRINFMIVF